MFADVSKQVLAHFNLVGTPSRYPPHIVEFSQAIMRTHGVSNEDGLRRFAKSQGYDLSPSETTSLFKLIDTDADGTISLEELIAFVGNDDWAHFSTNPKGSLLKSQLRHDSMLTLMNTAFPFPDGHTGSHRVYEASLQSEGAPLAGTGGTRITCDVIPFTQAALKSEVLTAEGEQIADGEGSGSESGGDESGSDDGGDDDKPRENQDPENDKGVKTFFAVTFPLLAMPNDKEFGTLKKAIKTLCKTVFARPIRKGKLYVAMKVAKSGAAPSVTISARSRSHDPLLKNLLKTLLGASNFAGDATLMTSPERFFQNASFAMELEKNIGDALKDDTSAIAAIFEKYCASASVTARNGFLQTVAGFVFKSFTEDDNTREALHMLISGAGYNMMKGQRLEVYGRDPTTCLYELIAAVADSIRDNERGEDNKLRGPLQSGGLFLNPFLHSDMLEENIRQSLQTFFPAEVTPAVPKKFFYKVFGSQEELKVIPSLAHFASKFLGMANRVELSTVFYKATVRTSGLDVFHVLPKDDKEMASLWAKHVGGTWRNPFGKKKKGSDDDEDKPERSGSDDEGGEETSKGKETLEDMTSLFLANELFPNMKEANRTPHVRQAGRVAASSRHYTTFHAYRRVAVIGPNGSMGRQVFRQVVGRVVDIDNEKEKETRAWDWCRVDGKPLFVADVTPWEERDEKGLRDELLDADVLIIAVDGTSEAVSEDVAFVKTALHKVGIDEDMGPYTRGNVEDCQGELALLSVNPKLQVVVVSVSGRGGAEYTTAYSEALAPFSVTYTQMDAKDTLSAQGVLALVAALPSARDTSKRTSVWDNPSHSI